MTREDNHLTGRTSGYRGVAIRCPGCAEQMRQLEIDDGKVEVDVCDACGGLWVDWFDGEVRAIATETLRVDSAAPKEKAEDNDNDDDNEKKSTRPSRNEAAAVGACPRCNQQLVAERYKVTAEVQSKRVDAKTSLVAAKTGAELLRCEDCMGAFVSRTSAEVLSWLSEESDEPPPSQSDAAKLQPLPWERFIAVLKRFLGIAGDASAKPASEKQPEKKTT